MIVKYYRIRHSKREDNNGFVVLIDYDQWPTGTLRSRGYLNPKNREFQRPMNQEEIEAYQGRPRLMSIRYKTWEELVEDERRVGTSEETIERMRAALTGERCPATQAALDAARQASGFEGENKCSN